MLGVTTHTFVAAALATLLLTTPAATVRALSVPAVGVMHTERAASAAAFADSIGVNVHLSYNDGPYGRVPAVEALVRGLGVKHLRDGATLGRDDVCRIDRAIAAGGVRFTYITQPRMNADQLRSWSECVGNALEAYEGPNEYDISHPHDDADWAATVREAQRALYRNVKSQTALEHATVIGPSLTTAGAYRTVGDLSAAMDVGNMHNYFAGHEPETPGWGLGGYGSIGYNLSAARITAGDKAVDTTENGYGTDRGRTAVDEATQAKYVLRMFFEQFAAGVPRTFDYELVDEGDAPFAHYGIVGNDLKPKPAYTALASVMQLLHDAAGGHGGALRFALGGDTDAVHHVVVRKADGRFYVALWIAAASYDPQTGHAIAVPERTLALHVATPLRHAALYRFGADDRLHANALPIAGTLNVPVDDRVAIVELTPRAVTE